MTNDQLVEEIVRCKSCAPKAVAIADAVLGFERAEALISRGLNLGRPPPEVLVNMSGLLIKTIVLDESEWAADTKKSFDIGDPGTHEREMAEMIVPWMLAGAHMLARYVKKCEH